MFFYPASIYIPLSSPIIPMPLTILCTTAHLVYGRFSTSSLNLFYWSSFPLNSLGSPLSTLHPSASPSAHPLRSSPRRGAAAGRQTWLAVWRLALGGWSPPASPKSLRRQVAHQQKLNPVPARFPVAAATGLAIPGATDWLRPRNPLGKRGPVLSKMATYTTSCDCDATVVEGIGCRSNANLEQCVCVRSKCGPKDHRRSATM